jgi:NTE family protein
MERKKIGLALSGGAARGFAHLGVVKVLQENNIPIDYIAGTSAGSLVGGGIASGLDVETLLELSEKISWFKLGKLTLSMFGLQNNEPLAKFIKETYPIEKIEDLQIPFSAVATDLDTGEAVIFNQGDLSFAIRASCCIPVIYTPIQDGDRRLVDGGVAEIVPCETVKKMGADLIIAVDVNAHVPKIIENPNNALSVMLQTGFLAIKGLTKSNLQFADVAIQPNLSGFRPDEIGKAREMFEIGRQTALEKLNEIKALIH